MALTNRFGGRYTPTVEKCYNPHFSGITMGWLLRLVTGAPLLEGPTKREKVRPVMHFQRKGPNTTVTRPVDR